MCLVVSVFIIILRVGFLFRQVPHFLRVLLVFELITFRVFLRGSYVFCLSENSMGFYFSLVFLVFGVVEAVLGLSLLVRSSRGVGRRAVKSYSLIRV